MGFSWSTFGFSSIHTIDMLSMGYSKNWIWWRARAKPPLPNVVLFQWTTYAWELPFSLAEIFSEAFSSNISVCFHNFQTCPLVWRFFLLLLPLLSPFSQAHLSITIYLILLMLLWCLFLKGIKLTQWVNSENFLHQEFQDYIYIYIHTHTHTHTHIHTHHLIQPQFQQAYLNIKDC